MNISMTKRILAGLFAGTLLAQTVFVNPPQLPSRTFANLGTPGNGVLTYCSDCQSTNPCSSGGSGAVARRENGANNCGGGTGGGDGANANGYYLVSRSTNAPTNAVNLGALTTGLMKIAVSGSVATPSTAAVGDVTGLFSGSGDYLKSDGSKGTPSGSGLTITTAHTWLICPLNMCGPPAHMSLVDSVETPNAQANKVFLVALMPYATVTIRRATISTGGVLSYLNSGFAVGIYNASGTRLTHGRYSTQFSYGGADLTLSDEITLDAGTLYYGAYAAEDAENSNVPVVTQTYQHLSLSAGSRRLVAMCSESATGTGASYTLPSSCTISAISGVPEPLRFGGANFLP